MKLELKNEMLVRSLEAFLKSIEKINHLQVYLKDLVNGPNYKEELQTRLLSQCTRQNHSTTTRFETCPNTKDAELPLIPMKII